MNTKQQTISKAVSISGKGLHTGVEVNLSFKPAEEHSGIVFKRIDLEGQPTIEADVDYVTDTSRGTTLVKEDARISTIEHVLSALVGLQIDNILIEVDNIECPIMDGSAKPFVDALLEAGIEEQQALRDYIDITKPIIYKDPDTDIELSIVPSDSYGVTVMTDYNSEVVKPQHASLHSLADYSEEISHARTFCFLHEIEALYNAGLVRGGDVDNAIVIVDKLPSEEKIQELTKLFNKSDITIQKGILNNVDLRYDNEMARHKLLDVLGDLALVGRPIRGQVFASKPGHRVNVEFAKLIKKAGKRQKKAPYYDPNATPLLDSTQIYEALPHEAPFKLVDKIVHLDSTSVIGVKNVSVNEPQFTGHFPNNPVFPGVLILETMAQVGGIFVLNTVPDPDNYWTYFMGIDKCKFRRMVTPGDTMVFRCELLRPITRGIANMKGEAYVGNNVVCEAEILASIVRKDA